MAKYVITDFLPKDYPLSILILWWKQNISSISSCLCAVKCQMQQLDRRLIYVESSQKKVDQNNNQERGSTEGSLQIVIRKITKVCTKNINDSMNKQSKI